MSTDETRGMDLRETVGYLIFRHVDIGDPSRDAALQCADDVIRRVAEEIAAAIEAAAGEPVELSPYVVVDRTPVAQHAMRAAAQIAREHGREVQS